MTWTERQRALLQGMGLRVWAPAAPRADAADPVGAAGVAAAVVAVASPSPMATAARPARQAPGQAAETPETGAPAAAPAAAKPGAPTPEVLVADDRAAQIAVLDWPALRAAVAGCQACSLCAERRQTVFGVGDLQAHWMVVGEAPGEQEDQQGEPFVGPSGELLDAMLRALRLTRATNGVQEIAGTPQDFLRPPGGPGRASPALGGSDPAAQRVYIANTLKCRPPRNRNPAPDELARCEPFLVRQIALLQPRIIVAMGRFAVQSLLRSSEPVGKLRGRVHHYQGVPLVVTYHPAYLLRNPADKARAWADLCLAAATAEQAA